MGLTNEAHTAAKDKDPIQCTDLHKLVSLISGTSSTFM